MQPQLFSVLLAVAALTACAAPPDPKLAKQETNNCQVEYRTGSSIPIRNCEALTDEQREQQKRAVDEYQRSMRSGSTKQAGGTGG